MSDTPPDASRDDELELSLPLTGRAAASAEVEETAGLGHTLLQDDPSYEPEPTRPLDVVAVDGGALAHTLLADESDAPILPSGHTSEATTSWEIGTRVRARYEILRLLGEGGMGRVYHVLDHHLGLDRALKTCRTDGAVDPERLNERIAAEVELLRQLDRPDYFPRVYDWFEADGRHAFVMEYVKGQPLQVFVRSIDSIDLDFPALGRIALQIGRRLQYLHQFPGGPILFKDLKPSNVLIDPESLSLRLIDFGIATVFRQGRPVRWGTPLFSPPEARDGRHLPAGDVYAFGKVLLYLLHLPRTPNQARDLLAEPHGTVRSIPRAAERNLPKSLRSLALRMCNPDPARRPPLDRALDEIFRLMDASDDDETVVDDHSLMTECRHCERPVLETNLICPHCGGDLGMRELMPAEEENALPKSVSVPSTTEILDEFGEEALTPSLTASLYDLRIHAANLCRFDGFRHLRCLGDIRIDPYDYQKEAALRVLRSLRGRALLADEVGLGKTIEAGLILKEYLVRGMVRRVLLLLPPALIQQWREEMARFHIRLRVLKGAKKVGQPGVWAMSLARAATTRGKTAKKRFKALKETPWDLIIIDEAHAVKNRETKRWQLVNDMTSRYLLLLTATPCHNRLGELYDLLTLLRPGHLEASRRKFLDRFSRGSRVLQKEQLRSLLKKVMIRNRRRDVFVKFPQREARTFFAEPDPEDSKLYRLLTDSVRARGFSRMHLLRGFCSSYEACFSSLRRIHERRTKAGEETESTARALELLKERMATGRHFKLALLKPALDELADTKLLLFAEYRDTQQAIQEALSEWGHPVLSLAGKSVAERMATIRAFRNDPDVKILLCNRSTSEGLNLQFCHTMLNYDIPWNPMRLEQRIGRIQRLGQPADRVTVVNLFASDTIEVFIHRLLTEKLRMFEEAFGTVEAVLGTLAEGESFETFIGRAAERARLDAYDVSYAEEVERRIDEARQKVTEEELASEGYLNDLLFDE